MRIILRKNSPFTFFKRKRKGGEATVIVHRDTKFKSVSITGKVKTTKGLADSSILSNSIRTIGFEFLRLFPFLNQKKDNAILTYSLPVTGADRDTASGLHYAFHYIIKDGSDIETVLNEISAHLDTLNEKINSCVTSYTKQVQEQSSSYNSNNK